MSDTAKLGIDIGTTSIKLAELGPEGKNKWKLVTAANISSSEGPLNGNQQSSTGISALVVKLLKESGARSRKVVAALPEDQISSHVVEMPLLKDDEVRQALQWQVEQYIPIPADKAVWSYQILKKDVSGGGMEVLLVAAAKTLVNAYTVTLERAGLEVAALETELTATARSEVPADYPLSLVVDIGSKGTDVGVIRSGLLVFARTIPTAGEAFTRAIETALGIDKTQAEQYKNAYGFSAGKLEGKLLEVMKPVLAVIGTEIRKTADFYTSKHAGEVVKVVTLSGGVAALPDVAGMLSGMIGMEVVVGDPFTRISMDNDQSKALSGNGPFYGVAIGLAMREL